MRLYSMVHPQFHFNIWETNDIPPKCLHGKIKRRTIEYISLMLIKISYVKTFETSHWVSLNHFPRLRTFSEGK